MTTTYKFYSDIVDLSVRVPLLNTKLLADLDLKTNYVGATYSGNVVTITYSSPLSRALYLALKKMARIFLLDIDLNEDASTIFKPVVKDLKRTSKFITKPTTMDDAKSGFAPGSIATSTNAAYICLDSAEDNAIWYPITSSESDAFSGVDPIGGLTITTSWQDIPLTFEHLKTSNMVHTASSPEVTVNRTAKYAITGHISTVTISGQNSAVRGRLAINTGSGYDGVTGTTINMPIDQQNSDDRATGAFTIIREITAGSKFKLQVQYAVETTTAQTTASSGLSIHSIGAGPQGPQGIPGSGSSITVKENGIDITNTPHTSLNFGAGVVAVDGGSGVANISGIILQIARKQITTVLGPLTTQIPEGSTPTSASGTLFDSHSITMNGNNTVRFQMVIPCEITDNNESVVAVVSRSTTVLAVASVGGRAPRQLVFDFYDTPGTGTHTYNVRVGASANDNIYINRSSSDATPWGGTAFVKNCYISLTEIL